MKIKIFTALSLLFGLVLMAAAANAQTKESSVSISVTESKTDYEFSAKFDPDKTRAVMGYMDDHLRGAGISFKNTQADADLTLDNKMTFHLKSSPGKLLLKFDKRKNSADFYKQFKEMCEGLKTVIGQNK